MPSGVILNLLALLLGAFANTSCPQKGINAISGTGADFVYLQSLIRNGTDVCDPRLNAPWSCSIDGTITNIQIGASVELFDLDWIAFEECFSTSMISMSFKYGRLPNRPDNASFAIFSSLFLLELRSIQGMTMLNIDDGAINCVANDMDDLVSVTARNLSNLHPLPLDLSSNQNLRQVDVTGSVFLSELILCSCPQLDLSNVIGFSTLRSLSYLDARNSHVTTVPLLDLSATPLSSLLLHGNRIESFNSSTWQIDFTSFHNLMYLDLSQTLLGNSFELMQLPSSLRVLYIGSNPEFRGDITCSVPCGITVLDISYTNSAAIPIRISGLEGSPIASLSVSGSAITYPTLSNILQPPDATLLPTTVSATHLLFCARNQQSLCFSAYEIAESIIWCEISGHTLLTGSHPLPLPPFFFLAQAFDRFHSSQSQGSHQRAKPRSDIALFVATPESGVMPSDLFLNDRDCRTR